MTNKEYIQSVMNRFAVSMDEVDILFAENADLNPTSPVDVKACKNALYSSFCSWIPLFESRTEGDMTIKWNWNGLRAFIAGLSKELGNDDPFAEKEPSVEFVDIYK